MLLRLARLKILVIVFPIFFIVIVQAMPTPAMASPIQELLRNRIESGGIPLRIAVGEELIYASAALPAFYERRIYRPAWIDEKGLLPHATSLLNAILAADGEGLRPADYHWNKIEHLLSEIRQTRRFFKPFNPRLLVGLDLLLTDAFLIYGSHLVAGRINPERIEPQWSVSRREADLVQVLEEALTSTEIDKALKSLLPLHPGYTSLRKALALYRQIAANGGWPTVSAGSKMQTGDQSDQISIFRQRLAIEGFIEKPTSVARPLFDDEVEQALIKFQIQNGLEPDGVLGKQTMKALSLKSLHRRPKKFICAGASTIGRKARTL